MMGGGEGGMMGGMGGGMMGGGAGGPPADPFPPVQTDIQYIQCSVCKALVKRAHHRASKLKDTGWVKAFEDDREGAVLKVVGDMCDTKKPEGAWLLAFDLVEQGDELKLKKQNAAGECEAECRTIEAACINVLNEADTDISGLMFTSIYGKNGKQPMSAKAAVASICEGEDAPTAVLDGSCAVGSPPLPSSRTNGGDNFKRSQPKVEEPEAVKPKEKKKKKRKSKKGKKAKKAAAGEL
jgi:hypothetical protein